MKYKPGDEVFIKAEITDVHPESERPYFVQPCYDSVNWVSKNKLYCCDGNYEQGLADAWELAKKIYTLEPDEREKMLGYQSMKAILEDLSAEYIADKIEAYVREKGIKVGDVVSFEDETKALVVDEALENAVFVFTENGCVEKWDRTLLKKTGKKISIGDLLRQIGE